MVEWQASAFVFLSWSVLRKPNSTTKADVLPLHFGEGIEYRDLFVSRESGEKSRYSNVELSDGIRRALTAEEKSSLESLPAGSRLFADMDLASSGYTPSC